MLEHTEKKIIDSINSAEQLYHRIVLIVEESYTTGTTSIIQNVAKFYDTTPMNINLLLSEAILELSEKQRQLKLPDIFGQLIATQEGIAFLDNIEILFATELKQDPLRLLQGVSRNKTVVVSWKGTFQHNTLFYAVPEHSEYRAYNSPDVVIVETANN